ncbi:hypothetical protein GW17_00001277, partial [Ensete ventricosum]
MFRRIRKRFHSISLISTLLRLSIMIGFDMTNDELAVTSSHPRIIGPSTWSTRCGKLIGCKYDDMPTPMTGYEGSIHLVEHRLRPEMTMGELAHKG